MIGCVGGYRGVGRQHDHDGAVLPIVGRLLQGQGVLKLAESLLQELGRSHRHVRELGEQAPVELIHRDGAGCYGHNGADEGFQALLTAFADTGRGVAIMANSDNGFALFPRLAARVETEYGWPSEGEAAEPLFSKVYVLARVRGADRAVAWYRTLRKTRAASELAPVDLNRPAALLLRDGSPADAARLLEASVQLHPATASTYTLLARARLDAGNREGAVESARLALELDPGNTDAAALLEKLRVK